MPALLSALKKAEVIRGEEKPAEAAAGEGEAAVAAEKPAAKAKSTKVGAVGGSWKGVLCVGEGVCAGEREVAVAAGKPAAYAVAGAPSRVPLKGAWIK